MSYPRRQSAATIAAATAATAVDDNGLLLAAFGRQVPNPGTMTIDEMRAEIAQFWAAYDAETLEVRARNVPVEQQARYMVDAARLASAYARRQKQLEGHIVVAEREQLDSETPPAAIAAAVRARNAFLAYVPPTATTSTFPWDDGLTVEDARRWLAVVDAVRRPTAHMSGHMRGR